MFVMQINGPYVRGNKKHHLYILTVLWLVVHLLLFSTFGIRDQFVDSRRYIEMSDYVLAHGTFEHAYQIFYAIPIILLAIFRFLFTDGVTAFVLFQSMLSMAAAIALYKSASLLFRNPTAGLLAAVIYLLWLDCMQWNTTVMTESIAGSLTSLVIYRVTHFQRTTKDYATLGLLVALCLVTRPTAVLIAGGAVIFLLTVNWTLLKERPVLRAVLLFGLAVTACGGAFLMLNEWDFTDQYERGNIVTYMDTIEGEQHYYANLRLDTSELTLPDPGRPPFEKIVFFAVHNPLHFLKAGILKIAYLVSGVRPYFSTMHNLYTAVWLSLIYGLFYIGVRRVPEKAVRNFCLAILIGNCLLVAVSAVDWDNRFFMPMEPGIVLLAGGGGVYALNQIRSQTRRKMNHKFY